VGFLTSDTAAAVVVVAVTGTVVVLEVRVRGHETGGSGERLKHCGRNDDFWDKTSGDGGVPTS
jgi:hypothetical protein